MALKNKDLTFVIKIQNQAKAALNAIKSDLSGVGDAGKATATGLNQTAAAIDKVKSTAATAVSAIKNVTDQTTKLSTADTKAALTAEKLAFARAKTAEAQSRAAIASLKEEDALNRSVLLEQRAISIKQQVVTATAAVSRAVETETEKTARMTAMVNQSVAAYERQQAAYGQGRAPAPGTPYFVGPVRPTEETGLSGTGSATAAAATASALRQQAAAATTAGAANTRLTAADNVLTRSYDTLRDAAAAAGARMRGIGGGGGPNGPVPFVTALTQRLNGLSPVLRTIGAFAGFSILSNGLRLVGAAVTAPITAFAEFEAQMKRVQAVAQASNAELVPLSNAAKELGQSTQFGAVDAGAALQNLIQNGLTAAQSIRLLRPAADFATVGQLTLAESADVLTKTLAQYQLGVDQAAHATDILNFINVKTNTDIKGLASSLAYTGSVANAFKVSLAETASVIGVLGDAGISGSAGGTAVRSLLLDLSELANGIAPKKAQQLLANLKINPDTIDPAKVGLTKALQSLKDAKLTVAELNVLFQKRGATPAAVLLAPKSAGQDQSALDKAKTLTAQSESKEAADFNRKQADIVRSSLLVRAQILGQAFNGLAIAIGSTNGPLGSFIGYLTAGVISVTKFVDYLNSGTTSSQNFATGLRSLAIGLAAGGAAALVASVGLAGVTGALVSATIATIGFTVALLLNPLVLIAAGVAAAVTAILYFGNSLYQVSGGVASGWSIIQAAFVSAYAFIKDVLSQFYGTIDDTFLNIGLLFAIGPVGWVIAIVTNWDAIVASTKATWAAVGDYVTDAARVIAGVATFGLSEVAIAVYNNWDRIYKDTVIVWTRIKGFVVGVLRGLLSVATGGLSEVAIAAYDKLAPVLAKAGAKAGAAYSKSLKENTKPIVLPAAKVDPQAQARADALAAQARIKAALATAGAGGNAPNRFGGVGGGGGGGKSDAQREAEEQAKIVQGRHDLLVKENLDLLAQEGLIGRVGVAREKFTKVTDFLNKLGLKGITIDATGTKVIGGLSDADTKLANSVITRISVQVDAQRVDKIAQGIYEDSTQALNDYNDTVAAATQLLKKNPEAQEAATRAVNKAKIAYDQSRDALYGLKQTTLDMIALSGLRSTAVEFETKVQNVYNDAIARGDGVAKASALAAEARQEFSKQAYANAVGEATAKADGLAREIQLNGVLEGDRDKVSQVLAFQDKLFASKVVSQQQINALTAQYIVLLEKQDAEKDRYNADIGAGAREGLQKVADSFNNVRASTASLIDGTFNTLSDNLQTFLKTGKFSIRSVLADISSNIIKAGVNTLLGNVANTLLGKKKGLADQVAGITGQDVSPAVAAGVKLGTDLQLAYVQTTTNVAQEGATFAANMTSAYNGIIASLQALQPGAAAGAGIGQGGGLLGALLSKGGATASNSDSNPASLVAKAGADKVAKTFLPALNTGLAAITSGVGKQGSGFLQGFGGVLQSILSGLSQSGGGAGGGANGFLGAALQIIPLFFAKGGIMTDRGQVPLRQYSRGGVANSPQLAMFGEGSTPEAYVPVPSGRIPVEIRGMGNQKQANSGNIIIAPQITIPITGGGGNDMSPKQADEASKALEGELGKYMEKWVQKEQRPGGRLHPNGKR